MAQLLTGKEHDIGNFTVKRVLPNEKLKMIGPFIFFDAMGPGEFKAGQGVSVRPHPHIGLSTLTYLFEGSILHRDSLGNRVEITPGDVNWMTSGRGIVHSERELLEVRATKHQLHGLQSWVALPEEYAEIEPSFENIKKENLPERVYEQVIMRLVMGEAYGLSSPAKSYSPMFYLDVVAGGGSKVDHPNPDQQAAIHVVFGSIKVGELEVTAGQTAVLDSEEALEALTDSRFVFFGGEKWEKQPHLHWNFVSFDKDRLTRARADWENDKFPSIPDDNEERIPLPE
jgi:redox-sensitive bicupin YhaK (pirin superfamily)